MSQRICLDVVAPPFAGHLFPLLQLASGLRDCGVADIRVLSTGKAAESCRAASLDFVDLLPDEHAAVQAIPDLPRQIGAHPLRLKYQFDMTKRLLAKARASLLDVWAEQPPDLVIADFTMATAGTAANQLGLRWWTLMPSPCVLECMDGVPAYLGGWHPMAGWTGRLRDRCGRLLVRGFKQALFALNRRFIQSQGFSGLYRADGSEAIYSSERILVPGMKSFEFERTWPSMVEFIGPLTGCPTRLHVPPAFDDHRPTVLVTLGTHIPWARERAIRLFRQVAQRAPELSFHYLHGQWDRVEAQCQGNFHQYGFVPYDDYIDRYDVVVHHGGTGAMYVTLRAGKPALVWPHDYDQFDHAARLVHHGLARRLTPHPECIVRDLRQLVASTNALTPALDRFQRELLAVDPIACVAALI